MCADEQSVDSVVLARRLLLVRKPLRCQGWPFKGSAQDHIVEERAVFLPCLVLFVDDLLLSIVVFG